MLHSLSPIFAMTEGSEVEFSRLMVVLHSMLDATNVTKQILSQVCSETHCVLKDWSLPVSPEIHECTCQKDCRMKTGVEHVEISRNIGKVIEQAKTVRRNLIQSQKCQLNRNTNKKLTSFPSKVTKSAIVKSSDNKGKHVVTESCSTTKDIQSAVNGISARMSSCKKSSQEIDKVSQSTSSSNDLKFLNGSRYNLKPKKSLEFFQTTYQKDFSTYKQLHKKPNIKNEVPNKDYKTYKKYEDQTLDVFVSDDKNNGRSQNKLVVDVDSILSHVLVTPSTVSGSDILNSTTEEEVHSPTCALNVKVVSTARRKNICGLQEALDVLGVPHELIKVLKSYQNYIQCSEIIISENGFESGAKNLFLQKLKKSNQEVWDDALHEPLIHVCGEYLSLFVQLFALCNNSSWDSTYLKSLQDKIELLENTCQKLLNLDISIFENHPSKYKLNIGQETKENYDVEWSLAGIWNKTSRHMFSGMKQVLNVRYRSVEHCKKLQENIQTIQRLQFQIDLLELLKADIIPLLKNMDPSNTAFPILYKTCCALCDLKRFVLPVLVKL